MRCRWKRPLALATAGAIGLSGCSSTTEYRPELFDALLIVDRYCEMPRDQNQPLPARVRDAVQAIGRGAGRDPERRVRIDDSAEPLTWTQVRSLARLEAGPNCENVLASLRQ